MDTGDDREKQQEHLRQALLAAADEEAAAIVEQARRDITVAVRRARRDLHLIRAQLNLCGLEVPPLALTQPVDEDARLLGEEVPQDAIVVGRTHALRHVVTEANLELAQLSAGAAALTPADNARAELPASSPPAEPATRLWPLIAAGVLLLVVAGGVAGLIYTRPDGPPEPGAAADVRPADAAGGPVAEPMTEVVKSDDAATANVELSAVSSSRIVLRTVRPVWMRIQLDGGSDVGRMYPEGTVREFTPARDVLIRAGDAGAVLLSVDGAPPTALGRTGQVLTRRIALEETPAPPPRTEAAEARPRDAPAPPAPAATGTVADQQSEILAKHERWLEAFVRGDRQSLRALTTEGFSLRDERTAPDRDGTATSTPQVSDIQIDVAGVGAVLTGRLRTVIGGVTSESQLSEVWVRNSQQQWALMGVRITPTAP